jgi:dTDP-4-dehydrorhamnose reductase
MPGNIYHFSGKESFTKYAMALIMADILGIEKECVSPDRNGSGGADRPKDSHLDTGKLEKSVPFPGTPFNTGIKPVLERLLGT